MEQGLYGNIGRHVETTIHSDSVDQDGLIARQGEEILPVRLPFSERAIVLVVEHNNITDC